MAVKTAIIMSIISIGMLAIYGADVMVAGPETGNETSVKNGFLHMNASIRGSIFGIIPSVLLIASFFITRKKPSTKVGVLILIGGALIIIGTGIILGTQGGTFTNRSMGEFGSVLAIGIIITILGGIKIKKSKRA